MPHASFPARRVAETRAPYVAMSSHKLSAAVKKARKVGIPADSPGYRMC